MRNFPRYLVPGLVVAALVLAGCNVLPEQQADPVRYFTLSAPGGEGGGAADMARIRPVLVAGHLRSRALAVRVSENEIIYLEHARWAEPLDEAITQILRNRLRAVGGGIVVAVQVQRCEPVRSEGNVVQLAATYTITGPGSVVHHGSFAATPRNWDGKDHGALVGLMRQAVIELAEDVAAAAEKK
jgi:uncharacterized lipoprotein YmbA